MNKIKSFLDRKIVTKDVGEETYITWREALSYAMGRGAQGMSTSMNDKPMMDLADHVFFVRGDKIEQIK